MIWLTGSSGPAIRESAIDLGVGLLVTPAVAAYVNHRDLFAAWAVDNGCFAQGDSFDLDAYLGFLDGLPREGCLFAPAPDVVGDVEATWERSRPVLAEIRRLGFPAAVVAQDGAERFPFDWSAFDALFVGGRKTPRPRDEWKLGPGGGLRRSGGAPAREVDAYGPRELRETTPVRGADRLRLDGRQLPTVRP